MTRRASRPLACLLAATVALAPGCRAAGQLAYDSYAVTSAVFTPNPVSMPAYFIGLGLGFIVGLPLCLFAWPLTLATYPHEDGDEFFISAALTPAIGLGALFGSIVATPFYPFGALWTPDDEEAPNGPEAPPPEEDDERDGDPPK